MRSEQSQILTLLSAGRINPAEAERLIRVTNSAGASYAKLWWWLPVLVQVAILLWQHLASLRAIAQGFTIAAYEITAADHFQMFLNR